MVVGVETPPGPIQGIAPGRLCWPLVEADVEAVYVPDGAPLPLAFVAKTLTSYDVLGASPEIVCQPIHVTVP
jgi:hypothetical protein